MESLLLLCLKHYVQRSLILFKWISHIFTATPLLFICLFNVPNISVAHSGGLNSSGCHGGSKPYHCHRSASEMTNSSSGGYRLRCSSGSRSKDCQSSENEDVSVGPQTNNGNSQAKPNRAETGTDSGQHTLHAKEPAITILGFNFDQSFDEAFNNFEVRFGCNPFMKDYCLKDDKKPIYWALDQIGQITEITFNCATFTGCAYSPEEIFQTVEKQFELVGNAVRGADGICDYGLAGERICITAYKSIRIYKDKFRRKPISFE